MKNLVTYKSSENISTVEDEQQLLLFDSIHPVQEDLERGNNFYKKYLEKIENNSKLNQPKYDFERLFELGLKNNKILYCKPDQLIESLSGQPNFIIPKYKVAIFLNSTFSKELEEPNENWKVFKFGADNINDSINICIKYIENCKKILGEKQSNKFTFVDLYSGIGGFRIPLEQLGGKCLGFSEIDKNAIETYRNNFLDYNNTEELELGSVTNIGKLPFQDIDLIVGGVPCQSWSVAGKMRGFDDPRGKLWNDTIRIIELNQPKTFVFENVKGLIDPRNRKSLELIVESFEKVGYQVMYKLLNSYDFGLPQNRERIYIIGIRNDLAAKSSFKFPSIEPKKSYLYEIIEGFKDKDINRQKLKIDPKELFGNKIPMSRNRFQKINELNDFFIFCDTRNGHTTIHSWDIIETTENEKEICMLILRNRRKQKYGNTDGNPLSFQDLKSLLPSINKESLNTLINKKVLKLIEGKGYVFVNSKNSSGINGLYRIYLPNSNIFSTLTATGTKDVIALENVQGETPEEFKRNFIQDIINTKKYRPITAREAGKLQGFPSDFAFHKDERIAKKQFGNAVSTKVIFSLGQELINLNIYQKV